MLRHRSKRFWVQRFWVVLIIGVMVSVLFGRPSAFAADLAPPKMTLSGFLQRYEQVRELGTDDDLVKYGQDALKMKGEERLKRLLYLVEECTILQNETLCKSWLESLKDIAIKEKNNRYINISDIYYNSNMYGNTGDAKYLNKLISYSISKDPIVRFLSILTSASYSGYNDSRLKFVNYSKAYAQIPKNDSLSNYAYHVYWYAVFVDLAVVLDVEGAIEAAYNAEIVYKFPNFKSPSLDLIARLSWMARRVDDEAFARRAYQTEYKLVQRNPSPQTLSFLATDCAGLEGYFGYSTAVLTCLEEVNLDDVSPHYRKPLAMAERALANARLGQTARAEAELVLLRQMMGSDRLALMANRSLPQIEAQLLANKGQANAALRMNEDYWRAYSHDQVMRFKDSVPQLVGMLRSDSQSLRRTAELQRTVILLQSLFAGLALTLALAAGYGVFSLRRLNRKLEASRVAAEQANHAKSQFLANISHEIRTPLNGVLGLAQAISADELTPVQAERIGVLRQSGLGLLAILNDLLDLAKIEAGKLTIEAVPFNPQEVLTAARHAIWATAEAKGLTVEAMIMPQAQGLYQGDPTRLRQIIDNLVSNAVKFTSSGRVDVILSRPADALVLTVKDTGIGMSPEAVSRIFLKFEQADVTTTRRFGGTGLGLSICAELAEAMGGAIQAASVEGEGTTFTVILPLERLGDVPDVVAVEAPEPIADVDQAPLRVLAAEDHPVNQLVLRTLLGQFGVEVTMASQGEEVLALFKDQDWDVVLMDVQMPIMDGPTATRAIRQFEQEAGRKPTPILALTANAMAHQLDDYRQAGCNGHVSKPIDASDLIGAMSRVLAEAEEVRVTEAVVV